jgi:hypothetical protein
MAVKKPVFRTSPEAAIQKSIIVMLQDRGWFVRKTHGNAFQRGFPDLFAYNDAFKKAPHGALRWIDVKVKGRHRYTKAQCQEWPLWELSKVGIWILMGTEDTDYAKLFEPPNFRDYWMKSYDKYNTLVEDILEEME